MGLPALRDFTCQNPECERKYAGRYPIERKFCPECHAHHHPGSLGAKLKAKARRAMLGADSSEMVLENRVKALLGRSKAMTRDEMADALDWAPGKTQLLLESMMSRGWAITRRGDGKYQLFANVAFGGQASHMVTDRGDGWKVVGFTSDNHLGSKHERLDVLHRLYDIFADEGVAIVYNAGNWIEGESRCNAHDRKIHGLTAQANYFLEWYPQRRGITTYFIAGDDHEGWYVQRELVDIGQYVQERARGVGRRDLVYLGYMEADVRLCEGSVSIPLRIQHGGGGSAYALSYTLQKMVESFQGGEKPAILCLGHYHKWDYCFPRNVHAFMPGCTQDQSLFMRKRKAEAHVGGVLVWLRQDPEDGHITRFRVEWIPFLDRGSYETRYSL